LASESNLDRGPTGGLPLDDAAELLDQGSDQAPAQGARAVEIDVCGALGWLDLVSMLYSGV